MILYTVASGERFINAAIICRRSFLRHNPGIKFKIFVPSEEFDESVAGSQPFDLPEFPKKAKEKKPLISLLFSKFGLVNNFVDDDIVGFVDADSYCQHKLPIEILREILDRSSIGAASDPKAAIRKIEIRKCGWSIPWPLYFNSGVVFWSRKGGKIISGFGKWFEDNLDRMIRLPFGDQTWLNIYLALCATPEDIGYFWNHRGINPDPRALIWHPGGRDSVGIEKIKSVEDSIKK